MFLYVILTSLCFLCDGQRTGDWDRCKCRWATWESWSKCSSNCYGTHRRTRKVWVLDIPTCQGFEACDGGAGGREDQVCNKRCDAGHFNGYYCQCPDGRYGSCCDNIVTCASPQQIENGFVDVKGTNFNDVITYSCEAGFNLTGNVQRTCGKNGGWSGSTPQCLFAESCKSNPCVNRGTCVDGLEEYTCLCVNGWDGHNCQIDVMPPVSSDCSDNVTIRTGERDVSYTWTVPTFHDPHGNPVTTSSNYVNNSFTFPWGDFTMLYTGFKVSNGMKAVCTFTVTVRPYPCPSLQAPANGYVLCNGWRSDYGQFCLVGCNTNFSLPYSYDPTQWVICGASGHWTPAAIPQSCTNGIWTESLFEEGDCTQDMNPQKRQYIDELRKSSFNNFCVDTFDLCVADNVDVFCGK